MRWIVIVFVQLFCLSTALAQQGLGIIKGTVVDKTSQAPLAGIDVVITSPSALGEQRNVTDEKGRYRIPKLPPGVYEMTITQDGYQPYTKSGIAIRADAEFRFNVVLIPDDIEEITITGGVPTVDIGSTQMTTNITEEFTKRVPISLPTGAGGSNRDIESVALIAPQVNSDLYGAGMSGTTSPENAYIVDGMSINDPGYGIKGTPLSSEFVSETNVVTSGYMPEYGKATGGVIAAVTKTGSNQFKGSAWSYFTPGFLEGKRERIKRAASTIVTDNDLDYIFDVGADIGGPIVKDKLWFYVGADYAKESYTRTRSLYKLLYEEDDDEWDVVGSERIDGTEKYYTDLENTLQATAKLDYRVNQNHRFALSGVVTYEWSENYGSDRSPNLNGARSYFGRKRNDLIIDSVLHWIAATDDLDYTLDTKIGIHMQDGYDSAIDGSRIGDTSGLAATPRVRWRRSGIYHSITEFEDFGNDDECDAPDGAPDDVIPCPVSRYYTGGPGFMTEGRLTRMMAQSVGNTVQDLWGTHDIKAGVDFELNRYDKKKGYSGTRFISESSSGAYFYDLRIFGFLDGPDNPTIYPFIETSTKSMSYGAFLQDSWEILVEMLTVNFGFRYDAQYIYGGEGQLAIALPNQWSPRVGVIFDPTSEGRSKIFGNFAIFYENIPLDIADRSVSDQPYAHGYYNATGNPSEGDCDPTVADPDDDDACFDVDDGIDIGGASDLNQSYVHNNGLVPIDPDLKPQSSSELMFGGEYALLDIVRLGVVYTRRWMNNVIEDMSRDEASTYFIGNPGSGIATDFPEAKRYYDAVTIYAMKAFTKNWLAQVSYTMAWLRGNYAGLFRPETGQLDPNINSDFDLRSLLVNRDGYLPGDQRHTIKVFGAYDFHIGKHMKITPGLGYQAHSGQPTNYLGAHEIYGNGEVFILERGAGDRLPWVHRMDLHVGFMLKLDETYSLEIIGDVFNIFNFQEVTNRDQIYTENYPVPIEGGTVDDLDDLMMLDYDENGNPIEREFDEDIDYNQNFGNPTAYQAPLTVRLGLRLTF
ncbi:MAG: TonB-dependent receptor [Myxococcota bacterium]|nr:TonB-dependent receptor [Myxococcota bacterium]